MEKVGFSIKLKSCGKKVSKNDSGRGWVKEGIREIKEARKREKKEERRGKDESIKQLMQGKGKRIIMLGRENGGKKGIQKWKGSGVRKYEKRIEEGVDLERELRRLEREEGKRIETERG